MHGKYPLPLEGALPEYPSRSQKENIRVPRHLEGWRAGNQKRARPCRLGAKGSAQTRLRLALLSLRPRTAPHGSCWPKWPVAYALRAPQTSVSATLLRHAPLHGLRRRQERRVPAARRHAWATSPCSSPCASLCWRFQGPPCEKADIGRGASPPAFKELLVDESVWADAHIGHSECMCGL